MDTAIKVLEIAGRLAPDIIAWIVDLLDGGIDDAEDVIRRDITDRRDEVRANRARRDEQLRLKYPGHPESTA